MKAYIVAMELDERKSFITFQNPIKVEKFIKVEYGYYGNSWYKISPYYIRVDKLMQYIVVDNFYKPLFDKNIKAKVLIPSVLESVQSKSNLFTPEEISKGVHNYVLSVEDEGEVRHYKMMWLGIDGDKLFVVVNEVWTGEKWKNIREKKVDVIKIVEKCELSEFDGGK